MPHLKHSLCIVPTQPNLMSEHHFAAL